MFLAQHIIMISEGSCDTEDRSYDAENTALSHRNQKQTQVTESLLLVSQRTCSCVLVVSVIRNKDVFTWSVWHSLSQVLCASTHRFRLR